MAEPRRGERTTFAQGVPKIEAKMGDVFLDANWRVSVVESTVVEGGSWHLELLDDGIQFLVATLQVTNMGNERAIYPVSLFVATDGDGRAYPLDEIATYVELQHIRSDEGTTAGLFPAKEYEFPVIFEIPAGAEGFTLSMKPPCDSWTVELDD